MAWESAIDSGFYTSVFATRMNFGIHTGRSPACFFFFRREAIFFRREAIAVDGVVSKKNGGHLHDCVTVYEVVAVGAVILLPTRGFPSRCFASVGYWQSPRHGGCAHGRQAVLSVSKGRANARLSILAVERCTWYSSSGVVLLSLYGGIYNSLQEVQVHFAAR